ncbi:MAG: hypothetical protein IKP58_10025 [Victivallales bacterium]|nr:hypothetical protein [Victivallales bacterium]
MTVVENEPAPRRKAVNGLWEKRWSDKLGDSEPFFWGLQSLTRGLFESQSSGERENVVLRLRKRL